MIFTAVNNCCILHGRVLVMCTAYALELARNLEYRFSHKAAHKCGVLGGRNWACLNDEYFMNFMAVKIYEFQVRNANIYAPNFEKVDGHIAFGACVGACVHGSHFLYLL